MVPVTIATEASPLFDQSNRDVMWLNSTDQSMYNVVAAA